MINVRYFDIDINFNKHYFICFKYEWYTVLLDTFEEYNDELIPYASMNAINEDGEKIKLIWLYEQSPTYFAIVEEGQQEFIYPVFTIIENEHAHFTFIKH